MILKINKIFLGEITVYFSDKRVLLVGHYGSGNYGDDIMLQSLIDEYSLSAETLKVVFFGHFSKEIDLKRGQAVFINRKNKLSMLLTWIIALFTTDIVVWGGGTCFTDEEGDGHFLSMLIARLMGKKIAYRAVGIGNLTRISRKLKSMLLFYICEYISFREIESIEIAKKLLPSKIGKFSFESDLGIRYLNSLPQEEIKGVSEANYMVVAWRDLTMYQKGNQLDSLLYFLCGLANKLHIEEIIILDVDNGIDDLVNNEIENKLFSHGGFGLVRRTGLSFKEKNKIIANAKAVITARLHIGIAAVHFNVPVYIYPYSPKIIYAFSEKEQFVKMISLA